MHVQRFMIAAAQKHCSRSSSSSSSSSITAILSKWFLVLQAPILAPRDTPVYEVAATQVVESPHPYLDSQDIVHAIAPSDEVTKRTVEHMEVVFDPQCRSETSCDYVTFWKDGARQGASKYHGSGSSAVWAGVGGTWPQP